MIGGINAKTMLKKGASFGFGVNSGFDTWRMVLQWKIVLEMSMRSLLCDMNFCGYMDLYINLGLLDIRMINKLMGHN